MKIGRLSFGKRLHGTHQFRWFYCPLGKTSWQRKYFVFFWWIGRKWYVVLSKKEREGK